MMTHSYAIHQLFPSYLLISLPLSHLHSHLKCRVGIAAWTYIVTVWCGILCFLHEAENIRTDEPPFFLELPGGHALPSQLCESKDFSNTHSPPCLRGLHE